MLVLKIILSLSGAFNCIHYNIFLEKIIWQISSILVHPMPLFPWLYYRMVFSFNTCWVDILVPQRKLAYTCPCLCIKKIQVDCNIVGKFAGSLNIPSWSFFKAYFFRHSCEPYSLRSKRQVQYQRRCALCCAFSPQTRHRWMPPLCHFIPENFDCVLSVTLCNFNHHDMKLLSIVSSNGRLIQHSEPLYLFCRFLIVGYVVTHTPVFASLL